MLLRRIFGRKRQEVVGGWRRLHNEEFHNFHASESVSRVIKTRGMISTGHVARMVLMKNVYKIVVGKPEEKGSVGRPRHR
jgi:hypothetical protein